MSVDEATGRRDILLTIMAPDMATLTALIIDWIGGIEGVYGTRSSLVTNVIVGAESWRANILTQRQVNQALPQRTPDRSQPGIEFLIFINLRLLSSSVYSIRVKSIMTVL